MKPRLLATPHAILDFLDAFSGPNTVIVSYELDTSMLPRVYGAAFAERVYGPWRPAVYVADGVHAKLAYTPGYGLLLMTMNLTRSYWRRIEAAVFIPETLIDAEMKRSISSLLAGVRRRARPWRPRSQQR